MVTIINDILLKILIYCDIITVVQCRSVSKQFQYLIDHDLALPLVDFSILSFRQRQNITDQILNPWFRHICRRASIMILNGTGLSHYGATKLVTDFTKELHVERCPRVDMKELIPAIAGERWLSYGLNPVMVFIKDREARGMLGLAVTKSLSEYSWAVVLFNNECRCLYYQIREYQPGEVPIDVVPCHKCARDVKSFTMDAICNGCGNATCIECQTKVCDRPDCASVLCKGCATERVCSLCQTTRCLYCQEVWVIQCYGCEAIVCGECQPTNLKCSVGLYRQYCEQCVGGMEGEPGHWCCDKGEFSVVPTL